MGANISLLAPNAHTVALRSYVDVIPGLKFLEVKNNTRFLKTITAFDASTDQLVVIKLFVKPPQASVRLHEITELLAKESALLAPYANMLVWRKVVETDSAGYLIRQMVKTNLYDRLSLRPFLAPVEKCWLVFQMLKSVELLHDDLHVCHGDLKTENFLVSSSNWLLLADFAQHTKPVYLPDDNPSEFVFYFDSSNRRACYVAPERFYNKAGSFKLLENRKNWKLSPAADLFSLGCVIAELYMDGEPPFSLSDLYRYKKGDLEPNLSGISDLDVQKIVRNLISLDPNDRSLALQILAAYRGTFFPEYFYSFLYDFMTQMNTAKSFVVEKNEENVSASDLRIESIYSSFDKIVDALGFDYSQDPQKTDPSTPYLRLNLKGMPANHTVTGNHSKTVLENTSESSSQGALIVLDTVFSLVNTIRRPANKRKACELILALSEHISDEAKLDRSLPYLCSFLDEFVEKASHDIGTLESDPSHFPQVPSFSATVASTSLIAMTNLLETCLSINPINAHVFPDFIFPKLKSLVFLKCALKEELNSVKATLSSCLPHLTTISERFMGFASAITDTTGELGRTSGHIVGAVAARCENDVKDITEALLTDPNVNVRIRLIGNILPVCQFFGVDKTNDIILPHLITYLNDPSYQLRLAFLTSVKNIGEFIGVLAFEQYLLPLLVQTLGDHEPFIVLKVLEIFNYFVCEQLINPKAQFNALSIYKELLSSTLMLLLQPNEWIRQSVIFLILSISENLLDADRFCFLYPLIKTYLSYDIAEISWERLYPCLTKPLSRQVFDMALTWLAKSSDKSLFWKHSGVSVYKSNGKRKLVAYSKDMGKSVYLGKSSSNSLDSGDKNTVGEAPLSHTDRQWVLKLKSIGMSETELWKISALQKYLAGISRSSVYTESGDQRNFELATNVNNPPLNIFCEVGYKSEPMVGRQKGTVFSLKPLDSSYQKSLAESISGSLPLSHGAKASASLQTNEFNIFAELNPTIAESNLATHINRHHDQKKGQKVTHRVFSVDEERIISATVKHNFGGTNPHIVSYLKHIDLKPSLNDFAEFGPTIKGQMENGSPQKTTMDVTGNQVAHINTNSNPKTIEAVTKLAVCPSSEFFVSGSETGALKVWDTSKLESVSAKNAMLSLDLGKEITDIVFIPQRFVFGVATTDGQIRLFRVHVVRGKNRKIIRYAKLAMIRVFKVETGYARSISFSTADFTLLLVAATSASKVVAYDIIKTSLVFELQNPPQYGIPNTFVISKSSSWLLLGTSEGVLCFWDLRFGILLRSWKVTTDQMGEASMEIKKLVTVSYVAGLGSPDSQYFAMIGGDRDLTIWEVPSFECREILSSHKGSPKLIKYTLQKLGNTKTDPAENALAKLSLNFDLVQTKSNTSMVYADFAGTDFVRDELIVTSTNDNRVISWNLNDVSKSTLLLAAEKTNFTKSKISLTLAISYEKPASQKAQESTARKVPIVHDTINDIVVVSHPYPMIVAAERNGSIRVYK
ncbi:phosphoinositide-3-kinase, regulatory subunit 4 [Metschnikowia aff. pulcherrima]|uniref:non-specific serine/threonine protein kinase n=1 Tax=Metschnikowia aff. pulcherrima TaxID=2163413 RepID=A0A4P6XUA2_9ASCO|nr:phosphoinositide-3-kinase, regulatory subunit 4 [Metschnikowia aff. pulcherrima]